MSLRILVGCKRVIDYAVKVKVSFSAFTLPGCVVTFLYNADPCQA